MPKKTYVGVNNKAKNVPSKGYIGIANKAKKLLKGYIGDANGKAQLFWNNRIGIFWIFYETVSKKIMEFKRITPQVLPPFGKDYVNKTNIGMSFYCVSMDDSKASCIFTISTDEDAIDYVDILGSYIFYPTKSSVVVNNEVWYFAYIDMRPTRAMELIPDCSIKNSLFSNYTPINIVTWIINNRIYSNDFVENYQVGNVYDFPVGNKEKTVRKAIGIFLYKNFNYKNEGCYQYLLSHVDEVVDYIIGISSEYRIVSFTIQFATTNPWLVQIFFYFSNELTNDKLIRSETPNYGYKYFNVSPYINYTHAGRMEVYNDRISKQHFSYSGSGGDVGTRIGYSSSYGIYYVQLSNIGLIS